MLSRVTVTIVTSGVNAELIIQLKGTKQVCELKQTATVRVNEEAK